MFLRFFFEASWKSHIAHIVAPISFQIGLTSFISSSLFRSHPCGSIAGVFFLWRRSERDFWFSPSFRDSDYHDWPVSVGCLPPFLVLTWEISSLLEPNFPFRRSMLRALPRPHGRLQRSLCENICASQGWSELEISTSTLLSPVPSVVGFLSVRRACMCHLPWRVLLIVGSVSGYGSSWEISKALKFRLNRTNIAFVYK